MIISRAPVRISLGGGGTDLPSYYERFGGFLISGTIDKYVLVEAHKQFYDTIKIKYSKQEEVTNIGAIHHNLFREALKLIGIEKRIELTSLADIPAGTGLGSSGAFLIALLNTLYVYKNGYSPTKRQLAQDACKIELEILKEHEGKQDKYTSAFGGINGYRFDKDGKVSVIPLENGDIVASSLEKRISIFFTGNARKGTASDFLKNQDEKTKREDRDILNALHKIKEIGLRTQQAFAHEDFDAFGYYLNEHWEIKKTIATSKPDDFINRCYTEALQYGALGGKIMGANTDVGFLLFYHPEPEKKKKVFDKKMEKIGLHRMPFSFDLEGVKTVFNSGR